MVSQRWFRGNFLRFFWPFLVVLFLIFFFLLRPNKPLAYAEIYIFQVGQGDAALIKSLGGEIIIVDGGPDLSILKKVGLVLSFWQRQIDYLILSHPHDDHLFGLIEIWRRYQVLHVLRSPLFSKTAADNLFSQLSQKRTHLVSQNQVIKLRSNCSLNFLYPLSKEIFFTDNLNDSSLVFKFECPGLRVLFTGDAGKKVEKELLENGSDLSSEVIKISHHGSQSASSPEFLQESRARVAIISVGEDNEFGHPSLSTLSNLANLKFKVFRTDLDGSLYIYANNSEYYIKKLSIN